MTTLTKEDIARYAPQEIALAEWLTLRLTTERDDNFGAPWVDDGHGPVSERTTREKAPGERLLTADRHSKRYYDFAEAVKIARRDRWDTAPYHAAFPRETKGEQAVRAAEADFEFMRAWCADEWHYIGVLVELCGADGCELGCESLLGVESRGEYWREVAADLGNGLIAAHAKEAGERAHWEARDVETVAL